MEEDVPKGTVCGGNE